MNSEQLISIFFLLIPIFVNMSAFWFHLTLEAEIQKYLKDSHTGLFGNNYAKIIFH